MDNDNLLLSEYKLNNLLTLKNRIIMAPMTRAKATDDLVPTNEMIDYYARRSDAGLIITEGTVISADALGHKNVPGIFSKSHIQHWKKVTDKVHRNHGLIFMQIWHVGRVSHPVFLEGKLPISPSETLMTGRLYRSDNLTHGKSRAASLNEIKKIINNYAIAAENAIAAGFDGVEIHGANGYLVDQFLHHHTNQRKDAYGDGVENMARFALDVINACGKSIGFERVGIRLSPGAYLNEMLGEERDSLVFKYLLEKLNKINIAYVHTGSFNDVEKFKELGDMTMTEFMRNYYQGNLIACGGYSLENAVRGIKSNLFDLVAFGRHFIANPDLVSRFATNKNLNPYDARKLNTHYQ